MSKASEWASMANKPPRLIAEGILAQTPKDLASLNVSAEVTLHGLLGLRLYEPKRTNGMGVDIKATMTPEAARTLARWILDTFGDET